MSPIATVKLLKDRLHLEIIVHYTARDRNRLGIQSDLLRASALLGLENFLLLGGASPSIGDYPFATSVYDLTSEGLVEMLDSLNHGIDILGNPLGKQTGFFIGVGTGLGEKGNVNPDSMQRKLKNGAHFIITQPVFDIPGCRKTLESFKSSGIPILVGFMPLISGRNAEYIHFEVPGISIPDEFLQRMEGKRGREGEKEGAVISRRLVRELAPYTDGILFMPPLGKIPASGGHPFLKDTFTAISNSLHAASPDRVPLTWHFACDINCRNSKRVAIMPKKGSQELESLDDFVKLSFFADIGLGLSAAKTIKEVMNQVMEKIGETFAPLNWSLLLKDDETGDLTFKLVVGPSSEKLLGTQVPKGEGIAGWIAENGQAVLVEDVRGDPRFSDKYDMLTGFRTESIIGVPLKESDKVIGVIELINRLNHEPFTPADLKLLSTIANYAAIAIEKVYYLSALKNLAYIDPLTGVFNRRRFEKQLQEDIDRSKRYGYDLSLLLIDIDDFKSINDSFGHAAGDQVLQTLAAVLKRSVRKTDIVARIGGDEFIILLPHTKLDQAENARQRILKELAKENRLSNSPQLEITIGLKSGSSKGISDLLFESDVDLYRQKKLKEGIDLQSIEKHLQTFLKLEETRNGEKKKPKSSKRKKAKKKRSKAG